MRQQNLQLKRSSFLSNPNVLLIMSSRDSLTMQLLSLFKKALISIYRVMKFRTPSQTLNILRCSLTVATSVETNGMNYTCARFTLKKSNVKTTKMPKDMPDVLETFNGRRRDQPTDSPIRASSEGNYYFPNIISIHII